MKRFSAVVLLIFCGCTSPSSVGDGEAARQVVMHRLGSDAKIGGPISKDGKKELDVFSPKDRSAASALLDRGAFGFLVFVPDYSIVFHTKNGIIADSIKVDRIVFVVGSEIVGDFHVEKKEPNQALEPTAPSDRGSSER
jgi:hypothetical protein